ncbi:MAG: hypothetical protein AAB690_02165 [Patescibacteria group bacterium]
MDPEEISKRSDLKNTQGPTLDTLSQIRTYQGDIANVLNKQNESLVSIQQTEITKRRASGLPMESGPAGHKKIALLVIGSIVLLILGSFGGWAAYREFVRKTTPPFTVVPESRLIRVSEEVGLDISLASSTRLDFIKAIREKTDLPLEKGSIRHIVLSESSEPNSAEVSTQLFLKILEAKIPSSLIRAFDKSFMLGVLGGEIPSHFLIIKVSSFENVFTGMLAWEANLAHDLGPLFATAEQLRNLAGQTQFTDITSKNKDMRVLLDEGGEAIILYSFFDDHTLIITDKIETLHIIIARLNSESLSR